MKRYEIEQLIKLWAQEQLTVDQAIGQLLLHIKALTEQLAQLEQSNRPRPSASTPGLATGG